MKTLVVVNPMSAHGKTGREWPALQPSYQQAFGDRVDFHMTQAPGEATDVVRAALANGVERVVSVGGDGTNHEVVNGFFDPISRAAIKPSAIFGFTAMGTGGDLARTFVPATDLAAQLARIATSEATPIDLVGCSYACLAGTGWEIAVNIASIGQGGDVCARVDSSPAKALGGTAPFLLASLESLISTRPWKIRLTVDDQPPREQAARNVIIANCRFHGGGMEVAPQALPDDGMLDVVIIGDLSRFATLRLSPDIYRGRLQEHAGVTHERARKLTVELIPNERTMLLEMDGEARGYAPATFEVMPAALRMAR